MLSLLVWPVEVFRCARVYTQMKLMKLWDFRTVASFLQWAH